jgi:hypothetical protein
VKAKRAKLYCRTNAFLAELWPQSYFRNIRLQTVLTTKKINKLYAKDILHIM